VGGARLFGQEQLKSAVLRYEPVARGEAWCRAALDMASALVPRPCATRDQAETLAALVSIRSPLGPGSAHYGVVDHSGVIRQFRTRQGVAERVEQAAKEAEERRREAMLAVAAAERQRREVAQRQAQAAAAAPPRQAAAARALGAGAAPAAPPPPAAVPQITLGQMINAVAQGLAPPAALQAMIAYLRSTGAIAQ